MSQPIICDDHFPIAGTHDDPYHLGSLSLLINSIYVRIIMWTARVQFFDISALMNGP